MNLFLLRIFKPDLLEQINYDLKNALITGPS